MSVDHVLRASSCLCRWRPQPVELKRVTCLNAGLLRSVVTVFIIVLYWYLIATSSSLSSSSSSRFDQFATFFTTKCCDEVKLLSNCLENSLLDSDDVVAGRLVEGGYLRRRNHSRSGLLELIQSDVSLHAISVG